MRDFDLNRKLSRLLPSNKFLFMACWNQMICGNHNGWMTL